MNHRGYSEKSRVYRCAALILRPTLLLVSVASALLADGKVFVWRNQEADIYQPTQKAVIFWDGREERLVLQTRYEGPAEDLAWIVPLPGKPSVKKGNPGIFEDYSRKTQEPDVAYTRFRFGNVTFGGKAARVVEWRRRIGAYDVALLAPEDRDSVVRWLRENEYGLETRAIPILHRYMEKKWWVVAARIHRDALGETTGERLARGTLHPLEFRFESDSCVYPLRLTSLAAGPVEELIYIEGPHHYVPRTLDGPQWQIDVYGGPRSGDMKPHYYYAPELAIAEARVAGWITKSDQPCLTKLRRVFEPEEMTDDVYFARADYARWARNGTPLQAAQGCTQYGRRRDSAAIPHLIRILSSDKLTDDALHRSAVWALGEISIDTGTRTDVETALLRCATEGPSELRMEAYLALVKARSEKLGPVLAARFDEALDESRSLFSDPGAPWRDRPGLYLTAQWLSLHAEGAARERYVATLDRLLRQVFDSFLDSSEKAGRSPGRCPPLGDTARWILAHIAASGDSRFLPVLDRIRQPYEGVSLVGSREDGYRLLLAIAAACGSQEALDSCARWILSKEATVLAGAREECGYTCITPLNRSGPPASLRTRVLRGGDGEFLPFRAGDVTTRKFVYRQHVIPPAVKSDIFRRAIEFGPKSEWYTLYLLSWIETPDDEDRDRLHTVWEHAQRGEDHGKRILAIDVLFSWKDTRTLLRWFGDCTTPEERYEAAWALAALKAPEAARIVVGEVRRTWHDAVAGSTAWLTGSAAQYDSHIDGLLKHGESTGRAMAIWSYLNREHDPDSRSGHTLAHKLALDPALNLQFRFLMASEAWEESGARKRDVFADLATEVLARDRSLKALETVVWEFALAGAEESLVALFKEAAELQRQGVILGGLVYLGTFDAFPVIERSLTDTWLARYLETDGKADFFRLPARSWPALGRRAEAYEDLAKLFRRILGDSTYPAGYRAFVAMILPGNAPLDFDSLVETLANEDIPLTLKRSLREKLEVEIGATRAPPR